MIALIVGLACGAALGCGDSNLLSGLADEDSAQAQLEQAQAALDVGDCQTALTLFTEMQTAEPARVDRRLDLSAAYLCRSGFEVSALVAVAADFGANVVLSTQVFQKIADEAVTSINPLWPQDLDAAEALLSSNLGANLPTPFNNDADARFNLAIVEAVRVVLTLTDILNFFSGVVDCAASQGSTAFANCQITAQNVLDIVNALQDADALLAQSGVSSELGDLVNRVLTDLNAAGGSSSDTVTCPDLTAYLSSQGFTVSQVTCV
jgi:hypothetical protein